MILTGGRVFDTRRGFVERDLCLEGDRIAPSAGGKTIDVTGCTLIPGLTDLHFHGCRGADFSDGDPAGLETMAAYELSRGVTQICPAGMTLAAEQLVKICQVAAAHRRAGKPGAELVGVNLEGPFLSEAKKGAQNAAWLQKPNLPQLEALMDASEGLVKLVSVAPEVEGAIGFVREASKKVTVSVAHTTANYEASLAAFQAGAREVTHLYNAMPPFAHRDPGVVGAAFDVPEVRCELICDGVHIHPAVVRATFAMFGRDRMILISDTMRAAGMPDGDYTLGGQAVRVNGKRATLLDGTIAGSVTDLMACMRTAVRFGVPLEDAVTAAAVNPAKVLGIYDRAGSLEDGKDANIAVLDEELELKAVIFHGEVVQGALV